MEFRLDIIAENLTNMLAVFGCHNGYDVDRKKVEGTKDYDPDFFQLPTHNTINGFMNQKNKLPKNATLHAFTSFYNKKFHANITTEDFCEKLLPCKNVQSIKLPKMYEGLYYLYTKRSVYEGNRTGLLYMYRVGDEYRVRALLFLLGSEILRQQPLIDFIKDPSQGMRELQSVADTIGLQEIYNYFEGYLDLRQDFCNIRLGRPKDYPFKTTRNEASIYFRRISEELRPQMKSAIGIIMNNAFDQTLKVHRLLLGSKPFDDNDDFIVKLLESTELSITDDEDFKWYRYNL